MVVDDNGLFVGLGIERSKVVGPENSLERSRELRWGGGTFRHVVKISQNMIKY